MSNDSARPLFLSSWKVEPPAHNSKGRLTEHDSGPREASPTRLKNATYGQLGRYYTESHLEAWVAGQPNCLFPKDSVETLISQNCAYLLPTNRRNTIPIANETEIVTRPKFPPRATVDGLPVKTRFYKPSEQADALSAVLRSLLKEDVSPHQITVLSPRKAEDCCAAKVTSPSLTLIGKRNGWKVGSRLLDSITYCTVSSFKGLENDFIVLTDVDELNSDWWKGVVYVGMTRARVGL